MGNEFPTESILGSTVDFFSGTKVQKERCCTHLTKRDEIQLPAYSLTTHFLTCNSGEISAESKINNPKAVEKSKQ